MSTPSRHLSLTRQLVLPVVGLVLAAVLANVGFSAWLAARRSAAATRAAQQQVADALRALLGATRVVYMARDDAAAAYRPRAAAGCKLAELRARIAMPMQFAPDLFHAALARGADLHIADIGAESVRGRLPAWQTLAFPKARGFLMLPVLVDGRPMGFFYADREVANAPPPDAGQSDAIRLLRNEIVLALRT
jgi:hypothetical protein